MDVASYTAAETFKQQTAHYRDHINLLLIQLTAELPFPKSSLTAAMQYAVCSEGKRLRPILVYAVGQMLGADLASLDMPAAAIECIHAYSLIHDDLPAMDNDDLRRGQPTCHKKYGESIAILAGDALQTFAFTLLAEEHIPLTTQVHTRLAMIAVLARASGVAGMCSGQALDLAAENQPIPLTLPQLEQIHQHKTGTLIQAAVQLGALAAGASSEVMTALTQYAYAIGLAFQIQDDILDVTGDTTILGKQQGADQQAGKSTYPSLLGLDQARGKAWDYYQISLTALDTLQDLSLNTDYLRALANYIINRDK